MSSPPHEPARPVSTDQAPSPPHSHPADTETCQQTSPRPVPTVIPTAISTENRQLSAMGPAPEFDEDSRQELIQQLHDTAKVGELASITWAFLWLSDLENIKTLAQDSAIARSSYLKRDYSEVMKE
ncbi:hypothetical protein BJX96DRAFT_101156 [Aspergillus floccosus]